MKIALGNDHAGTEHKKAIINFLVNNNHECINHGTDNFNSVDYPSFGHKVAFDVESKIANLGIVICGSGNGINMVVNKHEKIRGALCWNVEIAILSRLHNDANILSIPARYVTINESIEMVNSFINTNFEGGRHQKRIDDISLK